MRSKRSKTQWQPDPCWIDEPIQRLVRAVNAIDGIHTFGSCGGHPATEATPSSSPEGLWQISVDVLRNHRGWRGLKVLVRAADQVGLTLTPWLNGLDEDDIDEVTLDFDLQGDNEQRDALAELLEAEA